MVSTFGTPPTINNKPSIHVEDEKRTEEEAKKERYTGKMNITDVIRGAVLWKKREKVGIPTSIVT